MARTHHQTEATQLASVLEEIKRITREIYDSDRKNGTLRPDGHSRGSHYERLGVHLVAMHKQGVPPFHAIQLISHVAEHIEDIELATLMSMFREDLDDHTYPARPTDDLQ